MRRPAEIYRVYSGPTDIFGERVGARVFELEAKFFVTSVGMHGVKFDMDFFVPYEVFPGAL